MSALEFIVPLAALAASLSTVVVSLVALRRINIVHVQINSRFTEMLALAKSAAHGEGREEARQEQIAANK